MLDALLSERSLGRSEEVTTQSAVANNAKITGASPDAGNDVSESLDKVKSMISTSRKMGADLAADNLEYWLSGKGGIKTMPASGFANEEFLIEHLRVNHRSSFILGATKRLKGRPDQLFPAVTLKMLGGERTILPAPNELLLKGTATLFYEDSVEAPGDHELMFALGGFTVFSEAVLNAAPLPPEQGGGWTVSFVSWKAQIYDMYNWDKGKSTVVPFFGEVSDDELAALEKAGYGKPFKVLSETWDVADPQSLAPFPVAP